MFGSGAAIGIDPIIINSLIIQLQRIHKDPQTLMIPQNLAWRKKYSAVVHSFAQINIAHAIWLVQEAKASIALQQIILVLDV